MDHIKNQKMQSASQFSLFYSLNKAIKFLLPFSVLSIILSHSSSLPCLLHSFNLYISKFPMILSSYTINKNYMFLLCNGLLVVIVKNSGLVAKSSSGSNEEQAAMKNEDSMLSVPELSALDRGNSVLLEVEEEQEIGNGSLILIGGENGLSSVSELSETKALDGGNYVLMEVAEEQEMENGQFLTKEEDEEEIGLLSTEELNKRCDDFIRKMKEGIKFEAQQQLIIV